MPRGSGIGIGRGQSEGLIAYARRLSKSPARGGGGNAFGLANRTGKPKPADAQKSKSARRSLADLATQIRSPVGQGVTASVSRALKASVSLKSGTKASTKKGRGRKGGKGGGKGTPGPFIQSIYGRAYSGGVFTKKTRSRARGNVGTLRKKRRAGTSQIRNYLKLPNGKLAGARRGAPAAKYL